MNNLKEYLEAKKDDFKKTAKRAAITGLVAATILTGAAGLTSCDKDPVHADTGTTQGSLNPTLQPVNKIENIFKEQKQSFQLDYLAVSLYDGICIIDVVEMPNEEDFGSATAWGVYNSTEEFFNKIYAMVEANPNGINITSKEVKDPLSGTSSKQVSIELNKQALNNNPEVVELIYSEIKDKEAEFEDFEAPVMGD